MQPQQPSPLSPNPMPSDYLNQIAAPQQPSRLTNKMFLLLVGGALAVVIVVGLVIFSITSGPKAISTERLALRLQTLQSVSQDSHNNIKDSNLRSINGNLTTYLINANRDIEKPLDVAKIDLKKSNKTLIATENGDKLKATLEDARLNATFDRTYAKEMSYQLETTTVLMNSLLTTAHSASLKTFLDSSLGNLKSIQTQFSTYSSTNN